MTKQENQICHAKLPDQINKTCIKQSPHWFPVIDAWRRCITLWIYELAHHSSCKCFLQQVLSPNAFQDFLKSKIKLTFANLKHFCKETEVSSKVCCITFICFFNLVTQDDVLFFFCLHCVQDGYRDRDRRSPTYYDESEPEESFRIFVALFDYDPLSMSPNPDAADEELPFKEGQIIRVGVYN